MKAVSPKNNEERELLMATALATQMEGLPVRVIMTAVALVTCVDFGRLVLSLRKELRERAEAHEDLLRVLHEVHSVTSCEQQDCPICGIICCPYDMPEHTWKDGCPHCHGTAVDPIPEPVP